MQTPFSKEAPDIQAAVSDLRAAESIYREVPPEASDEAWLMLEAARQRLSRLIREAKQNANRDDYRPGRSPNRRFTLAKKLGVRKKLAELNRGGG